MSEDASAPEVAWVSIADAAEIAPNALRPFSLGELRVLVCRVGEQLFAIEDACSHTHAPLARGRLRGDCIVCPVHGARFALRDGRHLSPPASRGIRTFALRVVAGRVELLPTPIEPPGGPADVRGIAF